MKVYRGIKYDMSLDERVLMFVAVSDKKELHKVVGVSRYKVKTYWKLSNAPIEIEIALKAPGTIFKYLGLTPVGLIFKYEEEKC